MGDIDNDGYPDFAQGNNSPSYCQLVHNIGHTNNWLKVAVEGVITNRDGLGTWIRCYADDVVQTRYTACGDNYLNQDSEYEFFGMAGVEQIDSLVVTWLSGHVDTFYDLHTNQHLYIIEGSGTAVDISMSGPPVLCEGDTLLLEATLAESYTWSTGDTTQVITVATPGEYWVTITNNLGLGATSDTTFIDLAAPLVLSPSTNNISCYGALDGSINLGIMPSDIDTITWSNGSNNTAINALDTGWYEYTIIDNNMCPYSGGFEIIQPDSMYSQISTTDVLCFGGNDGSASIEVYGGTPGYTIDWGNLDTLSVAAGSYLVTVTDSDNCMIETAFEIFEPEELLVDLEFNGINQEGNGGASITIEGGTEPYFIEWSNGEIDVTEVSDLGEDGYFVIVTDSNGCQVELDFIVTNVPVGIENTEFNLYPNPVSGVLNIELPEGRTLVEIYNESGQLVWNNELTGNLLKLDTAGWANGSYTVRIQNANGTASKQFYKTD
jgi:hypothetical protein